VRVLCEQKQITANMQVGINENISNIKNFFKMKGEAFQVIYNGELVKREDTYLKKLVPSKRGQILLMSGSL
jgi:hypothetical protein